MGFYEEVIYNKRSLYRDYLELLDTLVVEYYSALDNFLQQSDSIANSCQIEYTFDSSWQPQSFKAEDYAWIVEIAHLFQQECRRAPFLQLKRVKISLQFSRSPHVEIRMPFLSSDGLQEYERILTSLWQRTFKSVPECRLLEYANSNVKFLVLSGTGDLTVSAVKTEESQAKQDKKEKIITRELNHEV